MASSAESTYKSQATAISNGIGSIHREHYGRGPDRIRTVINSDFVLTTLEDCFTVVEKKMISEGEFLKVRETRILFQDWMRPTFTEIVESATGREVRAFFSQVGHDPDSPWSSSSSSLPAMGTRRFQEHPRRTKILPTAN